MKTPKKISTLILVLCTLAPSLAFAAFDGARTYWPLPKNTNIVSTTYIAGQANVTWSNFNRLNPELALKSDMFILGYTRVQPLFGRTIFWQLLVPAASVDTSSALPVDGANSFAKGVGDPSIGMTVNVFGAPGMKAKEFHRYDLGFSLNLGAQLTLPAGQHDREQSLNVGSGQWKGRFTAPMLLALGPWVPGKRMTLEVMPEISVFSAADGPSGTRIEQDPVLGVEAHLTRDFTKRAFISLDYTFVGGGDADTIHDATDMLVRSGEGLNAHLIGATLGYDINDSMKLFLTHMQTFLEDDAKLSLEGTITKVTLSWAWHDVLEAVRDFRR